MPEYCPKCSLRLYPLDKEYIIERGMCFDCVVRKDKNDEENSKEIEDSREGEESKYDFVTSTQQAINMAVTENRAVRYITNKTRKEILAQVDDMKGCKLMKPERDSMEVAVIPEGVTDFSFDEVDTTIVTATRY